MAALVYAAPHPRHLCSNRVGVFGDQVKAGKWSLAGPLTVAHGDFAGTIP